MVKHNNGIALFPARTDTRWFHDFVFSAASLIFFLKGRIKFINSEGKITGSCNFPVCFASYDDRPVKKMVNACFLEDIRQKGYFLRKRYKIDNE